MLPVVFQFDSSDINFFYIPGLFSDSRSAIGLDDNRNTIAMRIKERNSTCVCMHHLIQTAFQIELDYEPFVMMSI